MPQTRPRLSLTTNYRVKLPERKMRSTSLNKHLENIQIAQAIKKQNQTMEDERFRSQANINYEIKKERKEVGRLCEQVKMSHEIGDTWNDILQKRKTNNRTENNNNTQMQKDKDSVSTIKFSEASKKRTTSKAKSRERSSSRNYLENYSRSYRYLRELVTLDNLSKERYQLYYESCRAKKKSISEENDFLLKNRLKDFNESVDEFVKRTNYSEEDNTKRNEDDFMRKLKMPDFSILMN